MTTPRTQTILLSLSATVLGLGGILGLAAPSLAGPASQEKSAPKSVSGSFSIDTVHSAVIFRVKHLDTSWAFGRFNSFSGEVELDETSPEKSSVKVTIEMESVDTANKKRDDHLRSSDFFDAVQFPTSSFTSTSVKKTGDRKYAVAGDFELHGATKPITIDLEHVGSSDTKMGVRAGFYATFKIKRSDYGVSSAPAALGEEVEITVSLETTQTESKR